ncbi:MAG TPA: hypothetical protein VJ787_14420 [Thermoleophilia bacterium]|nr:hypothetical protein [Thermoleophilia bacterium]
MTDLFPSLGLGASGADDERRERAAIRARALRDWERLSLLLLAGVITFVLAFALVVILALGIAPPRLVWILWLAAIAGGFLATWVYGLIMTALLQAWAWLVVIAFPPTALPGAIIFAWLRREELRPLAFND